MVITALHLISSLCNAVISYVLCHLPFEGWLVAKMKADALSSCFGLQTVHKTYQVWSQIMFSSPKFMIIIMLEICDTPHCFASMMGSYFFFVKIIYLGQRQNLTEMDKIG